MVPELRLPERSSVRNGIGKPSTEVLGVGFIQQPESRRDGTLMAHSYPNILVHCVFSTRERQSNIPDELQPTLWKYIAGIGINHGISVLECGGTRNHAHILMALPADISLSKAVQIIKANSSRWLRDHGIDFAWQEGYGAFSVSASHVDSVREYIHSESSRAPQEA